MARNDPRPTFLELNYTSAYAPHKMLMPTLPVRDVGASGLPYGSFQADFYTTIDALGTGAGEVGSYITNFVNTLKGVHSPTTTFTDWALWQVPDYPAWMSNTNRTQLPDVIAAGSLNIVGTFADASNAEKKATEIIYTFRAGNRSIFKLHMLDVTVVSYERNAMAAYAAHIGVRNAVLAADFFGASRANGKPLAFLQQTALLNKKLRNAYRMT